MVNSQSLIVNLMVVGLSFTLILSGSALAAPGDRLPSPVIPASLPASRHLASAPSTDEGAELFQFWCSTCHGDRGQGLTKEWRATWPEGKQNCWQSKCHAANHPPEGFILPKNVPALVGPATLTKFRTAQDLYVYNRAAMPYWSPKLLEDDEYRAITAFLVKANYTERGFTSLVSFTDDWATISLRPGEAEESLAVSPPSETLPKTATSSEIPRSISIVILAPSPWFWIGVVVVVSSLIIWSTRRFFSTGDKKG